MADLTAVLSDAPGDGPDRGQLLLVGAFALAVLVVAMALVLNGAAQTEALATEGTDVGDGRDAIRFQQSAERGVSGIIEGVNHAGYTDYPALEDALAANVSEWDGLADRGTVAEGADVNVTVDSIERGSRISQTTTRNFTDANANTTWDLSNETVDETRSFEMNVSRANLSTTSCGSCFTIVASGASDTWTAEIWNDSSTITVTVDSPSGSKTCTVSDEYAVVDFSAGSLGDGTCEFPPFAQGLSGPYNVTYQNGDLGSGTYELVVDRRVSEVDTSPSPYATTGSPSLSPAIYSARISVAYRTPRLTYANTNVRAVPGETDG